MWWNRQWLSMVDYCFTNISGGIIWHVNEPYEYEWINSYDMWWVISYFEDCDAKTMWFWIDFEMYSIVQYIRGRGGLWMVMDACNSLISTLNLIYFNIP